MVDCDDRLNRHKSDTPPVQIIHIIRDSAEVVRP